VSKEKTQWWNRANNGRGGHGPNGHNRLGILWVENDANGREFCKECGKYLTGNGSRKRLGTWGYL